ncbi:unnamed protein product [Adineta steineri]|uniref:BHLH domain-containing protein n=1 Tax=Adineta steineri TaxID=433720 RepID=A0A814TL90_9BILA|nr:unnamed protein product [Adineta steineri]CAF1112395.1 unnamed protein product [Adineta steineri]CAF1161629.1 unnamed protein product [Adineta steineri]
MNLPPWSCHLSPYYPANYYSYPYIPPSSYNVNGTLNSSIQTSLNSSSGYESACNETSLIDPALTSPSAIIKESNYNVNVNNKRPLDDSENDLDEENYYGRKKRRVLSRPQRQEANRRERQRMEIINDAYEQLRDVLPFKKGRKRQKMSRMDTVDGAIRYIHSLLEILHGPNYDPNWALS